MDKIADIIGGIIIVAMITAVVSSRNARGQITALGTAFQGSIRAALGH